MSRIIHTGTKSAGTATYSGSAISGKLAVSVDVTAIVGTLDIEVLWSPDGTNYASADVTPDVLSQIIAVGGSARSFDVKAHYYRVNMVTGGTSATFVVAVRG